MLPIPKDSHGSEEAAQAPQAAVVDTSRVVARFEKRHTTADNPRRDEFPDPEAPGAELAVVLFARNHKRALPRLARRAEAIDRLVLIQQLRLLLDREELTALQDGNEAGATWSSWATRSASPRRTGPFSECSGSG